MNMSKCLVNIVCENYGIVKNILFSGNNEDMWCFD